MIKVAPSILSADFGILRDQVVEAQEGGADYIHIDLMDGQFVSNLTMGPLIVDAVRKSTDLPLDVHMMVLEPSRFVNELVDIGADILTVHFESANHIHRTILDIKNAGAKAGIAINPGTSFEVAKELLDQIDLVLVMTVNPGYSGQEFIKSMLPKIKNVRNMLDNSVAEVELEVDGGINVDTVPSVVEAGADIIVAGSAVYNQKYTVAQSIKNIRERIV